MKIRDIRVGENSQFQDDMSFFGKVKYIFHFVTQAFLYAIFVFFIVFGLFMTVYFGDLLYNISHGNGKLPLFDAYVIVSPSMVPTIKIDDAIVVKRESGSKLEIGDIITFSSIDPSYPGLTVTHRIVGKEKTSSGKYLFRTKGDNNSVMDPSIVEEGRVYGKVILKIPQLGKVRRFLTTSYGFLFGIIVPALAIIVFDILKLFRKKDKNIVEEEELEII